MTTEVIEQPASAPEAPPQETETPIEEPQAPEEGAAPEAEPAAVPQVDVTEPAKDYVTREELEQERKRAADDALERDRRRRQTENARKAAQEQREREDAQEAADVIRAALVSQGMPPETLTDEAVTRTINRVASKKAERMTAGVMEVLDPAWDYLIGKEDELPEEATIAAQKLRPKLQALVDSIRPQIEAEARKGYTADADLPKRVDAEIAKRNAKNREGTTEIKRVNGVPAAGVMSWAAYQALSDTEKLAMPEAERRQIRDADRKVRLGQ